MLHIVIVDNFTVELVQLFFDVFPTRGCVMVTEIVQIMLMRLTVVCIMCFYTYIILIVCLHVGTTFSCSDRQFPCPSGYCIPLVWVCDEDNDCAGGEDEYCCE